MRVKSRWFRHERPKPPAELAGAVAFIVWRIARNALERMRAARFDIDSGAPYFAFLGEFVAFLIAIADRFAYGRFGPDARVEFTTALARRLAAILEDNARELLGPGDDGSAGAFIALVNERNAEYAAFEYGDDGPDFAFLRAFGHRVTEIMPAKDRTWTVAQVMESEAPEAVATLQKAMRDLLTVGARPVATARPSAIGE
ncbi:MAG TPA: hypothetical protein VFR50_05555 [Casimicrobiaceae bacterium]|jgi:hypothetical protein|nr:hypothetical protein [Casimicrobiaceae bacterium]